MGPRGGILSGDNHLPHLRLSQLAAVAFLVAMQFHSVFAQYQHYVTGVNNLSKVATEIQSSPDQGSHSIQFDYYGDVGTFKVDSPTSKVESLIFERRDSDSEAVITVAGTLLEIKNMKAKVTLKGLAFQLQPNAVLLSGADGAKVNGSLLIDSCFIFSDTLDNTFLSWLGDNLSSVEIKNSYIVVGGSRTAAAKISLSGGTLKLNNNLINFSGSISSPGGIFKEAQFISNTVNRTQFQLTGMFDAGKLPSMEFTKNLIAHKGSKDAFGGAVFYVVNYSNFDPTRVFIQYNKMFNTWNGFDYPLGAKFKESATNIPIDTIPGKAASEKWNWYTETLDNNETGLLSGTLKIEKYNVLPPDSSFAWTLPRGNLKVDFRPGLYPRQIKLDTGTGPLKPPSDADFHRRVFPGTGTVHFGPFKVDKITLGVSADFGYPLLLALDSLDSARAQPAGLSSYKSNPSVFQNGFGASRRFILVNFGNTPKGENIRVGDGTSVKATDKLIIAKVDSSGQSLVIPISPGGGTLATNLRSLGVGFRVQTSAVANSLFHIGAIEDVTPYSPDKVFWQFQNGSDILVPAVKAKAGQDSGKYTASANYSSKMDLFAYLVERLAIPAGGTILTLSEGSIRVASIGGFQLSVDSGYAVDPETYGSPTKGYSFTWPLKVSSDSIELTLKADSGQVMFVRLANGTTERVANARRNGNTLSYKVLDVDKGKIFFAAMEYNILKGRIYGADYDNTTVTGFRSSKSGKLGFDTLSAENQKSLGSAVKDYRFLGGRQLKPVSIATLNPDTAYRLEFSPTKGFLNKAMVEAYIHNGTSWSAAAVPGDYVLGKYLISQVPADAEAIAVVERLEAAEKYVKADTTLTDMPQLDGKSLTVNTSYIIDSINHITHFCIELQFVTEAGSVELEPCRNSDKRTIGQTITKTLQSNAAYQIRILYFIGEEEIKGRKFNWLNGTGVSVLNAANVESVRDRLKVRWHLLGFPVSGRFSKFIERAKEKQHDSVLDEVKLLKFRKFAQGETSKSVFEVVKGWDTLKVDYGDAYLVASSQSFTTKVTAEDTSLPLKPHVVKLDSGWILVANPFPFRQVRSKIVSNGTNDRFFYELKMDTTELGEPIYSWSEDSSLTPFVGYAYYAKQNETLTFNPMAGAAAKAGFSYGKADDLDARLEAPWGVSAMTMTSAPGRTTVPFLPAPGPGLQLRVGGGSGYMVKAIPNADQIDEPMEIRSPSDGRAVFTLNRPFRTGMAMRLVDLESGAVLDEAGARDMPIAEGAHAFRLIAGDESFVQARVRAFLSAAPAEISMSQNYPNPFRGRTSVELRWPAWQGGARKAVLEVIDTHGRSLRRMDLGEVHVGRQVVNLDASDLRTGVYFYRLTVAADGRKIRMQKRMLVTP